MDRLSCSRVSSTSFTTRTESVGQTSPFHSAKRRRLYGLNSRFDRMLQEVSWTSNSTKASRPHHKRAHSPGSSSLTNHDMPMTPRDSPNELGRDSRRTGECFVPTMKTGNQVNVESPPRLPEWLNNTLATLPPDHAVRCLTLPHGRPESPIRKDQIDWSPGAPEEDPVFAFQAPVNGHYPVDPTEAERQSGSDLATFRVVHYSSVEFQGSSPAASLTRIVPTVPFSTPGPRWATHQAPASCSPRRLFSAQPIHQSTSPSTPKVGDSPQPFSTPGPFAPTRPINGHVLDRGRPIQSHVAYDKVSPVLEKGDTASVLGFPEPFSVFPNDAAGGVSSPGFDHPTVYVDPASEHPSPSRTPGIASPASFKDKPTATNSSGLTWGSSTSVMRWPSGGNTTPRSKHAIFLSDIQPNEKPFHGTLPFTPPPIASSPDGDKESLSNLQRPHAISNSILLPPFPATPSPSLLSKCSPTDFGWVPSDTHTSGVLGSIENVNGANFT